MTVDRPGKLLVPDLQLIAAFERSIPLTSQPQLPLVSPRMGYLDE